MHSHITSYVRVTSSVLFVASFDEITINSSENHTDRFPFFYVNCLLMFCSVYCYRFFFKKNIQAFHCTCSLVAPLLAENFLWLAETRKNLNILSCIHVLDQVLNGCSERKQKIGYTTPLFHCVGE